MVERRSLLKLALAAGGSAALPRPVFAQDPKAAVFTAELVPNAPRDQSAAVQKAVNEAGRRGVALTLPAGRYLVSGIALPPELTLLGTPGLTTLVQAGHQPLFIAEKARNLILRDLRLDGANRQLVGGGNGLMVARGSAVSLHGIEFIDTPGRALMLEGCGGSVSACAFRHIGDAGLFALNSRGLGIDNNQFSDIGNNAIQIWRGEKGEDGTIVSLNRIERVQARSGGNGQNGNGINIFRADNVTISANHISDCAFSAIRNNAGSDAVISANTLLRSGEVALFVEFGFEGSSIASNLIDGAAAGISVSNFDQGGRLATIVGNIVRNISERSATNPDTKPYGIAVEADASLIGNTVENVPGIGLQLGWGPYLRNVTASANVVRQAKIGIGVSLAKGAGAAQVSDNILAECNQAALVGMAWSKVTTGELAARADGAAQNLSFARNRKA